MTVTPYIDTSPPRYAWEDWSYLGYDLKDIENTQPVPVSNNAFIEGDVVNFDERDETPYSIQHEVHARATRVTAGKTYKDIVGHAIRAYGETLWCERGVSGIIASVRQYGCGIASNEFAVINPADASAAAISMCAVQGTCRASKAPADASHIYRAVEAVTVGKPVTAAFMSRSASNDYGDGHVMAGLDMRNTKVHVGGVAIRMPQNTMYHEGTIIEYDPGDYTMYDRGADAFLFVIGNRVVAIIDQNGIREV